MAKKIVNEEKNKIYPRPKEIQVPGIDCTKPELVVEYVDPNFKLEKIYATDGSFGFDLVAREEIEIPCNEYFKQNENLLHLLFQKIKDIYEGKMQAFNEWNLVERNIKNLNSEHNKYRYTLIPMNIKIKYPEGYGALLIPRSSTFKKYGLLQGNAPGLIDTDFVLEHGFVVINLTNKNVIIPAGTRLAQLVFIQKQELNIVEGVVEYVAGHDGHGSTGN